MIITYFGKQFFKIQQGDLVIAVNPIGKDSKWKGKIARFGAQIAIVTTNHPDYNGIETVTYGDTVPLAITGPGDYEAKGVSIKGILSKTEIDGKSFINTIYTLSIEGITLCFLGALADTLPSESRESIMNPDLLFVPVGGNGVLSPEVAAKISVSLEPMLVIPMDYGDEREAGALKKFLKESGEEKVEPIDKLTLKRKDLDGKEGDVVILSYAL